MNYDYSENVLVQESAGHLLENELGQNVVFAYNREILGKDGTLGRTSYGQVLLTRYFRKALTDLNLRISSEQIEEAQKVFEQRMSTASLLKINEEKHFFVHDGIPVNVKDPDGRREEKRAQVVKWFFLNFEIPKVQKEPKK